MIKIVMDTNKDCLRLFNVGIPNARLIKRDEEIVGMIDFETHKSCVKIFYITIFEEYKRQHIAADVINMIKEMNKGKYMYGDSLPGALKFWESVGAEFDEDPDEDYLTPFHIEC